MEKLKVVHLVNSRFKKTVDHYTYRQADSLTKYARSVSKFVAKMAEWMIAQIISHTLNLFDGISTVGFLKTFKLVCETNEVYEDAAMWLFYILINKTTFLC